MLTDQVTRLEHQDRRRSIEYLLPRTTNIRRVFVDNSTTPVTFWVGSNHGASIVKLERHFASARFGGVAGHDLISAS